MTKKGTSSKRYETELLKRLGGMYSTLSASLVSSDKEIVDGYTQRDILHRAIEETAQRADVAINDDELQKYVTKRYNAIRKGLRIRNKYKTEYADT